MRQKKIAFASQSAALILRSIPLTFAGLLFFTAGLAYIWEAFAPQIRMLLVTRNILILFYSSAILFILLVLKSFFFSLICTAAAAFAAGTEKFISLAVVKKTITKNWLPFLAYEAMTLLTYTAYAISPRPVIAVMTFASGIILLYALCRTLTPETTRAHFTTGAFFSATVFTACMINFCASHQETQQMILLVCTETALRIFAAVFLVTSLVPPMPVAKHPKILFLVAPTWNGLWGGLASIITKIYPPVFVVLRAHTPADFEIHDFVCRGWHERYYTGDALVAITCFTSNAHRAYHLAKEFKKRGASVIMGGPHVTYHANEALRFCDAVLIGEAEGLWTNVLKDYEQGTLKKIYGEKSTVCNDFYSTTHRHLLSAPANISSAYIETTRGCKYNCEFCAIPTISERKLRHKPIGLVIEHLSYLKKLGIKRIGFIDNNIVADPVYAEALFNAMIPLKLKWKSCASIDIAGNVKLLSMAKKSGCEELLVGYEISPAESKNPRNGKFALADQYQHLSNKIKEMGIATNAHFIFGFDDDNARTVWELFRFSLRIDPRVSIVAFLTPIPGTAFFRRLLEEKRITNINWSSYTFRDAVFSPKSGGSFSTKPLFAAAQFLCLFAGSKRGRLIAVGSILYVFFSCL